MGGGELHQELKNLCVNSDWKYAVFWQLKHQSPMVLNWEDAYCDDKEKNDRLMSNWFDNMGHNSNQDLVRLAVARMSYRTYSIGEGVVGRVAGTCKHRWISGHQLVNRSWSSDEHFEGWKTQFAAGIRTVVVIAVVPHGVLQLGSLNTIAEDLKTVNHIREIFLELKSSFVGSADCSPCITDLSTSSVSGRFHKPVNNQDRTMENNRSKNTWSTVETINNHQERKNPLSDFIQSAPTNDENRNLFMPTTSDGQIETKESFKFPAGCELYEALGPAFYKQKNSFDWETMTTETITVDEILGGTSNSDLLTQRSGSEHLLEAVVAKVCCSDSDNKGSTSFGESVKPLQRLQPPSDLLTSGSVCYSFERFSSASVSRCSDQLDQRSQEPAKVGKKRARPGESCRPRPRDRQLIQDRIKELRQLVPSGSKCSIDSLLERTIKHMVFMQCITKHADKIDKCTEFKLVSKERGVYGQDQGSSWAMEVGNELEVCPIIVENMGVDGQMLVEMMCDEGVHFLEISEAIRTLGLTILKGVTDAYGDKTWMCFIVEGENNRSIHRMDILWPLVQILQSKMKA
ncbi:transcription factor EMB1444-like [Cynara cardunculus var. scolymus]|uniref:transcription factor EMB1444-like n=1 Tax=Cynara cardunculus var. scolymus TaxID=59895 RepID=UPI000D625FA6|nr:transcription factor EMB1444-like [Cynara cardunculus var. scolymus]